MRKAFKILVFLILILFLTYGIVNAENLDELKQKREEIRNQINQASKNMEDIKLEITETLEAISKLDGKIGQYETELETINLEVEKIQTDIKKLKTRLEYTEKDYKKQKEVLETRLVALYEEGETKYLDVLLNSKNILDFISNYYLISEIAEYDNDLLENISREKTTIEKAQKNLEEKQETLKESKKNQQKAIIALENAKVVRNSYKNELTAEEQLVQEEIDKYNKELDILDSQILYLTIGTIDSEFVGGEFAWPAPGYTSITSPFGTRLHPILKVYRLHNGLDIGAPTGAYIVAANSGIVTTSSTLSAYGKTIIIDHGGGISTMYAHGCELLVNVGDKVERGDVIMKAGSTGWSTGAHLHFGISINGTYVDPYPFITSNKEIQNNN